MTRHQPRSIVRLASFAASCAVTLALLLGVTSMADSGTGPAAWAKATPVRAG